MHPDSQRQRTGEILHHIVFQNADRSVLNGPFKGLPNMPLTPPDTVGANEPTMSPNKCSVLAFFLVSPERCPLSLCQMIMLVMLTNVCTSLREGCCARHARHCFGHCLYPKACCCVAVLTEGNGNLLPFISHLMGPVLQTPHVLCKHGSGLWIFGILGRVVGLKPHHVLPVHAFMWGQFIGLKSLRAGQGMPLC